MYRLILPFLLSGCMYQHVDNYDINTATRVCGGPTNIAKMRSHYSGEVFYQCQDGNSYKVK